MLPQAAFHQPPWDYSIVFDLQPRLPQHRVEGVALQLHNPNSWLLEEEHSVTVYSWLDPQRMSYDFSYGSPWFLAGLIHALAEVAFLVIRLRWNSAAGRRSGRHHHPSAVGVVFVIKYSSWA